MSQTSARGSRYAAPSRRTSSRLALRGQGVQHSTAADSSDDEVLSPMKLSAITKALLGGGHGSEAPSTDVPASIARRTSNPLRTSIPAPGRPTSGDQESSWKRTRASDNAPASQPPTSPSRPPSRVATRRSSVLAPAPPASTDQESSVRGTRLTRHSRTGSNPSSRNPSPVGSRDSSPAPRKRVVRLGAPNSASGAQNSSFNGSHRNSLRTSLSSSTRGRRPESLDGAAKVTEVQSPLGHQDRPAKTPVVRTVRIAVGSSGQKPASGDSSEVRSKYSARSSEHDVRNSAAAAAAPSAAPQSSMRVKRVGKTPGSFLSGPARRGRRRQSEEEDADGQPEADVYGSSQEPGSHQLQSRQQQEAPSSGASEYPDFAASGSPVSARDSARDSARAALRRQKSTFITPVGQRKADHDHRPLAYRIPTPPAPESAGEDKENEAPADIAPVVPPMLRASNPPRSLQKAPAQPVAAPINVATDEPRHQFHAALNNHALAARSDNIVQRPAPPPPPKMSVVETATAAAGASTTVQAKKRQFLLRVNGKTYTRIDSLGRGGSGKVYRVSAENGKLLALKRVSLEGLDERTIKGYQGEIDLLQRLAGVNRVIQLIDHEFNSEKKMLSIVLEAGELDFNTFLRSRLSEDSRLDPVFVRYWWKEMVECLQVVHDKDIIHTDLKPANFVLAQGRLKVIDFGIANAIQTDMTVNVHRDAQIGTPNYMSPESLMDSKEYAMTSAYGQVSVPQSQRPKHFKLGKASDIWSLGCILYQMVYGLCPFAKVPNLMARVNAIKDWGHPIDFPEHTEHGVRVPPSLIRTMRRCLNRNQTERPTCEELLSLTDPFLYPMELSASMLAAAEHGDVIPITPDLLRDVVWDVAQRVQRGDVVDSEILNLWPTAYWASCKRSLGSRTGSGGNGAVGAQQ
ncbi:kinase-like domain-containing protein [Chaetomidium leptoderma]|uniref:Kinase-like domain-containing protein n=1 Tax=Chaetomidium leptoderma TaxID=669021 RepID=A0AAN6ZXJ6_9PEZI|nr:kinase-like domain-containing protein [Chaetomidium leptoderma]